MNNISVMEWQAIPDWSSGEFTERTGFVWDVTAQDQEYYCLLGNIVDSGVVLTAEQKAWVLGSDDFMYYLDDEELPESERSWGHDDLQIYMPSFLAIGPQIEIDFVNDKWRLAEGGPHHLVPEGRRQGPIKWHEPGELQEWWAKDTKWDIAKCRAFYTDKK